MPRAAAAAGAPHPALRPGRGHLRLPGPHRRLLVPLLRRQGAPASRLLRHRNTRINGDAALTGYCYGGRKVFCVQYYDTKVPAVERPGRASPAGALAALSDRGDRGPSRPAGSRRSTRSGRPATPAAAGSPSRPAPPSCRARSPAGCSPSARSRSLGELLHGAGGRAAYVAAAAIALLAAVLEVRGTRIVPQIRRQLPEHWRRVMPMPLAAALYGVLLGTRLHDLRPLLRRLGAGRGQPRGRRSRPSACSLGAAFGIGRAIPIVVLAPLAGATAGIRATELMCERDGVYLGLRRGDAAALLLVAVALVVAPGERRGRRNPGRRTPPIRRPRQTRCSSSGSAARR